MLLKTIPARISIGTMVVTLALMAWTAQPWGDNYAYQNFSGYLSLLGIMAWAAAPLVVLAALFRLPASNQALRISSVVLTSVICIASLYLIIDARLIRPDAQGGLIFIALPIYQWVGVGIASLMRRTVARLGEDSADGD
jgi:hypothetical protein